MNLRYSKANLQARSNGMISRAQKAHHFMRLHVYNLCEMCFYHIQLHVNFGKQRKCINRYKLP